MLAILFVGMRLILPLGSQGQGSQALLSFGFLILAAYTVGEMATRTRMPRIVGYMVAGVLFGPHLLEGVSAAGVGRLAPVADLAVALIAFLAGAELQWSEIRDRGTVLLKIMAAELGLAFVVIAAAVFALHGAMPAVRALPTVEVVVFALLFSSVAVVHSPAVTLAVLSETRARGPVARTTLGVVLLADVAVVLLFSAVLALARTLTPPPGATTGPSLALVLWEIGGALVIGALLGVAVASYLRWVGKELMLFAVLMAFFGLEVARVAHVELLLTLLTAGFVAENASRHGLLLRHAMERSASPIFVVFFALAGARIDLTRVGPLLPLVLPIALARAGAIWAGVRVGARWAGVEGPERAHLWLGLVPQAGVAIGLATVLADVYPVRGADLAGLLLALIAVNQIPGPILAHRALVAAGEAAGEAGEAPVNTRARRSSA
jgi:Kef-type K+ transport system membrane component KefB